MTLIRRHLGDWISIRVQSGRTPPRVTITITFGELPDGWARKRSHARTWAALFGLICIAPFVALIGAALLKSLGVDAPYTWISSSPTAIIAATMSIFFGIPVAIAVNLLAH